MNESRKILGLVSLVALVFQIASAQDHTPELDLADYPVRPVPFTNVTLDDTFWAPRIETNREVTLWYSIGKCEQTGRIDNFAVAGGLKPGGFRGTYFNDSDVMKVIEGAAYSLAVRAAPKLDQYLDELIAKIAAAQEDDGYLFTARTIGDPAYDYPGRKGGRWSHLAHGHELYNVGHLYEAAVAHWQATGKRSLLDVAIKNADLICKTFGPNAGQRVDVPGHEEIEIGLVRLYRATGDAKYLRQAKFFVDMRGRESHRKLYGPNLQDHKPVVEQAEAVGHAVRAGYLYAGVADVAALTGEKEYVTALDHIWENIVSKKMHLTGGIGANRRGEMFGANHELPNDTAYLETCAAIAHMLMNHRMFLLHGDGKYIDVLERILYNGLLSGVSLSGDRFFYPNPLAFDGRTRFNKGALARAPWFGTSCCPVNLVRLLPSLGGYVYAQRNDSVFVNLYVAGRGRIQMDDHHVTLEQTTRYPWDGKIRLDIETTEPIPFALRLRIPGWATGTPVPSDLYRHLSPISAAVVLAVNGKEVPVAIEHGYAVLSRRWQTGDVVTLDLPMPVRRLVAHRNVVADRGRIAFERGPLVYCIEAADHEGTVRDVWVADDVSLKPSHRDDFLGGVTVLTGKAAAIYRQKNGKTASREKSVTMIPYYAWAHRQTGEMAVWIPRSPELAVAPLPRTIATDSQITASHVGPADSLQAMNDQVAPNNSNDQTIPRFTWWNHRGTTEWVQYDFAEPALVSQVDLYWFDDTGQGQCRTPKGWKLLYRDGDSWQPVVAKLPFGTAKDRFNRLDFAPVETDALRIEVELQEEFSSGILEWQVAAHGSTQSWGGAALAPGYGD